MRAMLRLPVAHGGIVAAALACALAAVLTTAQLAAETRGDEDAPRAALGLAAKPPNVARMALGPAPVPQPLLPELPRLVLERSDGSTLVDVAPFDRHGAADPAAFDAIARAFAPRSGEQVGVHPRLVELLVTLSLAFDGAPLILVSGFREAGRGTRKTSYHVAGMAADVAIRGIKPRELREAAARLGAPGVGLYPSYVHVDVRHDSPYRWIGGGRWRRWR
jgi:uncharacterized protein YcbK (DUF882 family)